MSRSKKSLPRSSQSLPNRKLLCNNPSIRIAGLDWPVPPFAPRQNRIVVKTLMSAHGSPSYDALCEITFAALTRAHPDLDRAAFEDWPIPLYELVEAVPVISRQTGMMKPRDASLPRLSADEPPNWDAIIADFCNFLPGTTPDYWEDALTWERYEAQQESWRKHPPVALLAAGYLGFKPREKPVEPQDAVARLMGMFPGGQIQTIH